MNRRAFMKAAAAGVASLAAPAIDGRAAGGPEVLHNGITVPRIWPPPLRAFSPSPQPPPYLLDPPAVIPVDLGRQLFVDDFLIESTTLRRRFHHALYYPRNPLLTPTTPWETFDSYSDRTGAPPSPAAMVFSDGVFYDPYARHFKMWYMGGYAEHTCCAVSADGLSWSRPAFDIKPATNIVMTRVFRDSNTVWLDHDEVDPGLRFKMATYSEKSMLLYGSADGIHWQQRGETGPTGDRSTMFYNPFRRKWVFSIRDEDAAYGRVRRYWEADDFFGARWRPGEPPYWVAADAADIARPDYRIRPQIYNLDAVAYESVLIGLFTMWRGEGASREKPNDVCLGFSRDGFHWSRPDREAFIPVSERVGDWNWANVQSAGGCCVIVGDTLRFYVSGRAGVPGTSVPGVCSTGMAMLRRDGFASMEGAGTLLTRPISFGGSHLFVNADLAQGELRAGIDDEHGRQLPGLSIDDCRPVRGNSTSHRVLWTDAAALARASGRPVRLRFQLSGGALYAFWIARAESGHSGGYVAAGGPAFSGARDI